MEIDSLTEQGFAKLLARLGDNPDRAGDGYEELRLMLVKFFEWRDSWFPEDDADETINRVVRKLDKGGEEIQNLEAYCLGVARLVFLERLRAPERRRDDLESLTPLAAPVGDANEAEEETRLKCFRRCMENLPPGTRELLVAYFQDERRARIDHRKQLAKELGISPEALRRRVKLARDKMEKCVNGCLKHR
jgi:RNA polymerase sigma factor (sigma-70 family)